MGKVKSYYEDRLNDDNFGEYDMGDDPEETWQFYQQVQKESVWTICVVCEQKVKLRPDYDKCNTCMDKLERGLEW